MLTMQSAVAQGLPHSIPDQAAADHSDTGWTIGYQATQQNLAYNIAVDILNREPDLTKRNGRNHSDAMNKRIIA